MKTKKPSRKMLNAIQSDKDVVFTATIPCYRALAYSLLATQSKPQREYYRKKIAKFICWWRTKEISQSRRGQIIPDVADVKLEKARKAPSWRRIARCIAKNDVYCTLLGFSIPKSAMK